MFGPMAHLMAAQHDPNAVKPGQPEQFDSSSWDQAQAGIVNALSTMPKVEIDQPEQASNPFKNPFVLLGMAAQGRAGQALQMGAQIDQQNEQRVDAWRGQMLQAENYRQLRRSNLQEKLATLEAQEAQAQARFYENQAANKIAQGQLDVAERRVAVAEGQAAAMAEEKARREARSANWTTAVKDIPALAGAAQGVVSTLEAYKNGWVNVPGQGPVSLADPDPNKVSLANAVARSNIAGQIALIRAYGFDEEAARFSNELNNLITASDEFAQANPVTGDGVIADQQAKNLDAIRSAVPGFDPATQQPEPGNVEQAQAAFAYQQGLENQQVPQNSGSQVQPFDEPDIFSAMFQTIEDQSVRNEMTVQIAQGGQLEEGREQQLRLSNYRTVIGNGIEEDPGFLRSASGRAALWQGVEAALDNVAGNYDQWFGVNDAKNYGTFRKKAASHAAVQLGIPIGHILNNRQAMGIIKDRWHTAGVKRVEEMEARDNPLFRGIRQ